MANTQVTGPVHHYVTFPYNPGTAFYLGTAKVAPKVRIQRAYKKVFNDLTGQLLPFERIFQGEEGQIISPINRFNQSVYGLIAAAPRQGLTGSYSPGSHGPLDIGAKVYQNSCFFGLILQFPFAGTANSPSSEGMPVCYYFPVCVDETDDFTSLGTAEEEIMMAFTAQQAYFPFTGSNTPLGGTLLYTNSLGGIALPTPN